jgi:hypothetical protein
MLSVIMMKVKCCEYGSCVILVLAQYELLYIASSMSLVIPFKFKLDLFKNIKIEIIATLHKSYKTCTKLHHICCYAECHNDESGVL